MGRVGRYKKLKSVDPFAKGKKGAGNDDLDRNLPPDVKNHQAPRACKGKDGDQSRSRKRRLPEWAKEELKATAKAEREFHANPFQSAGGGSSEPKRPKVALEPKQEGESLREFKKRIRGDTAKMLRDDFREHSSTAQKKKRFSQEKKLKKKLQRQGLWEETLRLRRQAERGGFGGGNEEAPDFPPAEKLRFGDVAHAPPNLAAMAKPRGSKKKDGDKPWARRSGGGGGGASGSAAGGGGRATTPRSGAGAGGARSGHGAGDGVAAGPGQLPGKEDDGGVGGGCSTARREMEAMRDSIRLAYEGLKQRRRSGRTQFVGSML